MTKMVQELESASPFLSPLTHSPHVCSLDANAPLQTTQLNTASSAATATWAQNGLPTTH